MISTMIGASSYSEYRSTTPESKVYGSNSFPINHCSMDSYRCSVSPAHSDSSNSNAGPTSPSNNAVNGSASSKGGSKRCGVCGDVAKSMHFGGLSCDSCKAFFRRSVQNAAYKGFSCPYDQKCVIGVTSRKACQFCRFEKCLSIGMEKSWVMPEKERRKLMEQRQEKRMKQAKQFEKQSEPSYSLNEEVRSEIALIVSLYHKAYKEIPYEDFQKQAALKEITSNNKSGSVLGPWLTFCGRMAYFFSLFKEFSELCSDDQFLLLQTALTSAGLIMGSVVYDGSSGKWSPKNSSSGSKANGYVPNVALSNVQKMVPKDLVTNVDSFFRKFQQICVDEKMAMILILISLYSSEIMGLKAKDTVQKLQERYTHILDEYIKYLFKDKASLIFPKAIVSLADVRVLAEQTYQMKINSSSLMDDMKTIEPINHGDVTPLDNNMSKLNLNGALSKEKLAKRARLAATGDSRDFIYQKIWNKVLDQRHITSMKLRAPSLLPFIIPIVKSIIKQDTHKLKYRSSSTRKISPRGGISKPQRKKVLEHRRNQIPHFVVKEEATDSDLYDDPSMDSNTALFSSMEISDVSSGDTSVPFGARSYNQDYESHSNYCSSPPVYANSSEASVFAVDCNNGFDEHMASSSPYDEASVNLQMSRSLRSSDVALASPGTPSEFNIHNFNSSSPESAYSPFSSGSSSSSFEDSTGAFSDIEIDVLASLIECVASQDPNSPIEMMDDRQVKEVIPLPLLTELQRKLSQG